MLNPDSVGRTFEGGGSVTVTQSEIDAFCAVICEGNTSVAPPTFSIRITMEKSHEILSSPEIGLDWSRVVHGEQEFSITRPISVGDVLNCSSTIEDYRVSAGNEIVTIKSDLRSNDQLVVSTRSILVVRA